MVAEPTIQLAGAVEGPVDEAVLRKILLAHTIILEPAFVPHGKPALLRQLNGYNNAARYGPWLVLVDLDQSAECPPGIVRSWLPDPAPLMCFRVAVRAIEAWLLADRESAASFLGVAVSHIPARPEELANPKLEVVNLARRSTRRAIREDLVPRAGSGRVVGPAYSSRLIEYARGSWRPEVAARSSDSLQRLHRRLAELVGKANTCPTVKN